MAAITRVRALRAELALPPKAEVTLYLDPAEGTDAELVRSQEPLLRFLLRPRDLVWGPAPEGAPGDLAGGLRIGLVAAAAAPSGADRQRLAAELDRLEGAIAGASARLGDDAFLGKAPPQVVEQQRVRLAEMQQRREQIRQGLDQGLES